VTPSLLEAVVTLRVSNTTLKTSSSLRLILFITIWLWSAQIYSLDRMLIASNPSHRLQQSRKGL
jgi:hypothetical protein